MLLFLNEGNYFNKVIILFKTEILSTLRYFKSIMNLLIQW